MSHILIAEDESRIASFLQKGLRASGFATTTVADGEDALYMAASGDFDLVLLDIGLPGKDGFAVLRELRRRGSVVPVIVLTARSGVDDTVAGLEGGADDYIAKPFRFEELLARVRLRLHADRVPDTHVLRSADISLDLRTRVISADGVKHDLSSREFALAEFLIRHAGQVLSREQLLSRVWGYDYDPGSNVVDVYIRYLRKKIGAERIETVRGAGYRLVQP
jgi:two-component system copper resistance phosphate regulon response regulator CusR